MTRGVPDSETVRAAIALAGRAPSIHNSQPWLWTMRDLTLQLTTAEQRRLGATDPAARDMLLSCGAAVQHAQVAFAALGWATDVRWLPGTLHPDRVAALRFRRAVPSPHDTALSAAICARRSDRRPYDANRAVTDDDLHPVLAGARRPGIHIGRIDSAADLTELDQLMHEAIDSRTADPAWLIEQQLWADPYLSPGVGIPSSNTPHDHQPFGRGTSTKTATGTGALGTLLLLATDRDDPQSCLEAGAATSALLLEATATGLSTCVLSLVTEVDSTRSALRRRLLADAAEPQLLVRIGWQPADSEPLPATPRLRLDEVLRFAPGPSASPRWRYLSHPGAKT